MLSEWETGTKWKCKSGQRIPPPCLSYKILFLSGCSSHLTQLHPSVYHPPTDWVKEFNQSSARRISLLLFRLPARWSTYFTTAEAAYNISLYFWFGSTSFHNNSSPGLHYFFLFSSIRDILQPVCTLGSCKMPRKGTFWQAKDQYKDRPTGSGQERVENWWETIWTQCLGYF